MQQPAADRAPADDRIVGRSAMDKARRRLIPFLFLLYIVAYLDRVNVGFAALQMNRALGFSAAVYGLGAGLFFVSYVLFEVPSNLALARFGARRWIGRIMVSWGLASVAMMFVQGVRSFYALRFLLGAAEAGFFPGMVLYLTRFFPAAERARAVAWFMTATALAGVVGGPLSGALLALDGVAGLAGWQWLFLLEGVPAVALGVVVFGWLPDGPADATWLDEDERRWIATELAREHDGTSVAHARLADAARSLALWHLAALYFTIIVAFYGIGFWLPSILQALSGLGAVQVGLLSAVPYLAAAVGMVAVASSSDRTGERRWHVAAPALVGAAGLAASALLHDPVASLVGLTVAAGGIWSTLGPFWTLPPRFLRGTAAAGGIAIINSVGNVGGFVGPFLVGWVKDRTGQFGAGLFVMAGGLMLAAVLALAVRGQE